ncbi:hypothetical protein Poli38472_009391 [Pythium oligandrum]|uniref:Uncharacterized protein n=1 Tax=Pythium oligandrum TaxID=41045 RepID=A0A8K1CLF5_PYTOL|nr:hypothetical protein Poli38472_009391 [Pythium oligandrum]|eukprot:TMW65224.1 hypothetical protein Poli38472_009391 [Pythium oligandrum]
MIRRLSSTVLSSLEFRTQSILSRLPSPFARFCYRLWHGVTKIYHAVDLRNEYHGGVYLTRVVIQMVAHTYCAYEASTVVSEHWMNDLRVALMVANSWVVPCLQLLFRKYAPQGRLLSITLNLTLDIVSIYVIPIVIMLPTTREFDTTLTNFPEDKWYTDKWFAVVVFQFRFIGVASITEFLARIFITYNVARNLRFISLMLRKEEREQTNEESTAKMAIAVAAAIHPAPAPPARRSLSSSTASLLSESKEKLKQQIRRRCLRLELVHSAILIALGAVVLRVHIKASELEDRVVCSTPVFPWFAVQPSCLFLEFNCEKLGLVGAEDELDEFLEQFDERHLGYLSIRHCPFVQMPPRITQLTNLVGLKLYKSAVHSWNADAALTSTDHPNLRLLILADVHVTEFPEGLLSTDFPQELLDIEFIRCNLTDLPSNLDERWPKRAVLVFEHMPFQTFPLALTRLQPASISLAMSNIDTVPAEMMDNMFLYYIVLNGNPIKTLPSPVSLGTRMYWLSIISTELSSLPAHYSQLISIDAGNTPYCTALLASSVTPKNVDCASSPPSQLTMFPKEELNE